MRSCVHATARRLSQMTAANRSWAGMTLPSPALLDASPTASGSPAWRAEGPALANGVHVPAVPADDDQWPYEGGAIHQELSTPEEPAGLSVDRYCCAPPCRHWAAHHATLPCLSFKY